MEILFISKRYGEKKKRKTQQTSKIGEMDTDLPIEIADSFVVIWKQEGMLYWVC